MGLDKNWNLDSVNQCVWPAPLLHKIVRLSKQNFSALRANEKGVLRVGITRGFGNFGCFAKYKFALIVKYLNFNR